MSTPPKRGIKYLLENTDNLPREITIQVEFGKEVNLRDVNPYSAGVLRFITVYEGEGDLTLHGMKIKKLY